MSGVVSLTMGNSVLPLGNRLVGHMDLFRKLLLCQALALSGFPYEFAKFDIVHTPP